MRSDGHLTRSGRPVVLAVAVVLLAVSCASTGVGSRPGIRVTNAMMPAPASPTVAAAYFTIHNLSSRPDTLETATTDVTPLATVHRTVEANGVSTMVDTGPLTIPGHGTVKLTPGALHLMLDNPRVPLLQGGHITVTLRFRRAGAVTFTVPVVNPADVLVDS